MKQIIGIFFILFYVNGFASTISTAEVVELIIKSKNNLTIDDSLALSLANQAMNGAKKLKDNDLITKSFLVKANAVLNLGNKILFKKNMLLARKFFNESKKPAIAISYYSVWATYYYNENKLDSCLKLVLKTLTIAEKINDTIQLINDNIKLQRIYAELGNFKESLKYNSIAAELAFKVKDFEKMGQCFYSRAYVLNNNNQHDSAMLYLDKALMIQEERNDTTALTLILSNKAYTYSELKNFSKAIETAKLSLSLRKRQGNTLRIIQGALDLAEYYTGFQKPKLALILIDSCYTHLKELQNNQLEITFYEIKSRALFVAGDYQNSLGFFKRAVNLKDSLFSSESNQKITDLQKDYEITSRQNSIDLLNKTRKLKELELDKKSKQNFILLLILSFIFILLLILIFFFRNRVITSRKLALKNEQINKQNNTLKILNSQLIESEEELLNANEAKGQLLSIISHDISSPIKALYNYEEALITKADSFTNNGEFKDALIKLHKSTNDIYLMSNNLLDYAQTQQEGFKASTNEVNLKSLIGEIVNVMDQQIKNKNIIIENKIDKNAIIQSDKNILAILFRNIISNAIKFSPNHKTIKIDWNNNSLSISDEGNGIEKPKIDLILQGNNFHSSQGTSGEKGTGLGMKIVVSCVQKLNAKLEIKSEAGKGTNFTVKL